MDNGDRWSCVYDHESNMIDGLEGFMDFYAVKTYWFMFLSYHGGSKFVVNIFSPKCVEILYPKLLPPFIHSDGNEVGDVAIFNRHSITEEKNGAFLFFNVAFSSCSLCSFVVQSSHLKEHIGKVVCFSSFLG